LRYSGKEQLAGLYYYGYRFYSSGLGRWINRDPIGTAGGINLYGFVSNNPANYTDYRGLLIPTGNIEADTAQEMLAEQEAEQQARQNANQTTGTTVDPLPLPVGPSGGGQAGEPAPPQAGEPGSSQASGPGGSDLPSMPTDPGEMGDPGGKMGGAPKPPDDSSDCPCDNPSWYHHYTENPNLGSLGLLKDSWITDDGSLNSVQVRNQLVPHLRNHKGDWYRYDMLLCPDEVTPGKGNGHVDQNDLYPREFQNNVLLPGNRVGSPHLIPGPPKPP